MYKSLIDSHQKIMKNKYLYPLNKQVDSLNQQLSVVQDIISEKQKFNYSANIEEYLKSILESYKYVLDENQQFTKKISSTRSSLHQLPNQQQNLEYQIVKYKEEIRFLKTQLEQYFLKEVQSKSQEEEQEILTSPFFQSEPQVESQNTKVENQLKSNINLKDSQKIRLLENELVKKNEEIEEMYIQLDNLQKDNRRLLVEMDHKSTKCENQEKESQKQLNDQNQRVVELNKIILQKNIDFQKQKKEISKCQKKILEQQKQLNTLKQEINKVIQNRQKDQQLAQQLEQKQQELYKADERIQFMMNYLNEKQLVKMHQDSRTKLGQINNVSQLQNQSINDSSQNFKVPYSQSNIFYHADQSDSENKEN